MSVVPTVRLPITASHINLLTFSIYRCLMAVFGCPEFLNICMHLYDFVDVPSYAALPLKERIGYLRMRRMRNKCSDLEKLISLLVKRGYRFAYLSETAAEIAKSGRIAVWRQE